MDGFYRKFLRSSIYRSVMSVILRQVCAVMSVMLRQVCAVLARIGLLHSLKFILLYFLLVNKKLSVLLFAKNRTSLPTILTELHKTLKGSETACTTTVNQHNFIAGLTPCNRKS